MFYLFLVPESPPFQNGCLVISNHFLCKELVHHPIETTTNKWMFQVPGCNLITPRHPNTSSGLVFQVCFLVPKNFVPQEVALDV